MLLCVDIQFSQHQLLGVLSFPGECFQHLCPVLSGGSYMHLRSDLQLCSLVHLSIFVPIPHCFHGSIIYLGSGIAVPLGFCCFCLGSFGYPGPVVVPYEVFMIVLFFYFYGE